MASLAWDASCRWMLMALSTTQAAQPTNQIHRVHRIVVGRLHMAIGATIIQSLRFRLVDSDGYVRLPEYLPQTSNPRNAIEPANATPKM